MNFRCAGRCHCGAVRFEVALPGTIEVRRCNCSICSMTGHLHLTVARDDFTLLAGEDELVTYTFNTGVARHLFCRTCGVKSFYVPRSHPDAWSVNVNCVALDPGIRVNEGEFDGRHWESNVHELDDLLP